ncbi:hypothetical protein, partial [Pseudoflavonifractor sp. An44]|uniref:hypothetical protein n=1 Tax=Pseudoflavonifractor sp. An44 TaxID=1965635 RepID=UPI0019D15C4D
VWAGFCMPKTLRKFHILDSFLLLRVKKDVPQNLRFATHPSGADDGTRKWEIVFFPLSLCNIPPVIAGFSGVSLRFSASSWNGL